MHEKTEEFLQDPKLLSFEYNIAKMRAVLSQYETNLASPELLNESVIDIMQKCITTISRDIERLVNLQIKREYLVSVDRMNNVIKEFARLIGEFVPGKQQEIILKRLEVAAMKDGNGKRGF